MVKCPLALVADFAVENCSALNYQRYCVQVCIALLIFDIQFKNQDTNVLLAFPSGHFDYCLILIRTHLQNNRWIGPSFTQEVVPVRSAP